MRKSANFCSIRWGLPDQAHCAAQFELQDNRSASTDRLIKHNLHNLSLNRSVNKYNVFTIFYANFWLSAAHAHENDSEFEQTFCATYWVMVLAISKGRQKWSTLHSFPPTVQRWSRPPFWFRFQWTFGNFVSRSFPKLVPLVSPKTRPHSAMHEKLVRTCRRRNTQCTLACTYWCTWCTLACTCTIAPGVLHKCSMAHITLTDMHFSQLGAIAQLEKELSKDWLPAPLAWTTSKL